jgi:hypothetical protein
MRGFAIYHRDSRVLEWDATAERSYLETIGHPGPQLKEWYVGKTKCETKG